MVVVPQLVVIARLVPRYDLSSWVLVTTLNVQCKTMQSTHYHEVLLRPSATSCNKNIQLLTTQTDTPAKARFPLPELTARVNGPS